MLCNIPRVVLAGYFLSVSFPRKKCRKGNFQKSYERCKRRAPEGLDIACFEPFLKQNNASGLVAIGQVT